MTSTDENPMETIERLIRATNSHDLEGIVSCFAEDYALEAPIHPARSFRGAAQVRANWSQMLGAIPDLSTRILRSARDGGTLWTEWEMSGTRRDGASHQMRGVFIFGVAGGLVRWGRMFLEPLDRGETDMSGAVKQQLSSG